MMLVIVHGYGMHTLQTSELLHVLAHHNFSEVRRTSTRPYRLGGNVQDQQSGLSVQHAVQIALLVTLC
jgi:hypothetical protein